MKQFEVKYPQEKFLAMLCEEYSKRAGIVSGTSKAADDLCTRLTEWLYGRRRFNCLFIQGAPGTGKTTLVEALVSTIRRLADMGVGSTLKMRISALKMTNEGKLQDGLLDMLSETKGLVIDDLGSEPPVVKIYGSEVHPMEQVIKRRSDAQLPTIVTSNLTVDRIAQQYQSERMADVLAQYDKMVLTNIQSFRRV